MRCAVADGYVRLISAPPATVLVQLQGHGWMRLREAVPVSPGVDVHDSTSLFAYGGAGAAPAAGDGHRTARALR